MSKSTVRLRPRHVSGHIPCRRLTTKETIMAKYLMLKHYRMPAEYMDFTPMDQWSPDEVDAHIAYMNAFADRLREAGEFVDSQALSPEGTFVQSGGPGKPPVTDGPFPERSEEHTSELQSRFDLVCRLLLEKKNLTMTSS